MVRISSKLSEFSEFQSSLKKAKVVMNLILDDVRLAGLGLHKALQPINIEDDRLTIRGTALRFSKKSGIWGCALTNSTTGEITIWGLNGISREDIIAIESAGGELKGVSQVISVFKNNGTKTIYLADSMDVSKGDLIFLLPKGVFDTVEWFVENQRLYRKINNSKQVVLDNVVSVKFKEDGVVKVILTLKYAGKLLNVSGTVRPRNVE